jgi:hypothetical protein
MDKAWPRDIETGMSSAYVCCCTVLAAPVSLTPPNSLSPVSLTPVINFNSRISPRKFEKIQNGSNGILGGPGEH